MNENLKRLSLDTTNLQTFVTIADKLSFSRAARSLHITQSAASKRISALETELGVRLFDRIGRQIQLTETGHLLLDRADSVLHQLRDIVVEIDNLSENVSGTLQLGTSHHIGLHRLPPALKYFNIQYPQVNLDISFLNSESACAEVQSGHLELAVITLPNHNTPNLKFKTLWPDPLYIVIAHDHPRIKEILHASPTEKLRILKKLPAILPQPGTYTRQIMEREFQKQNLIFKDKLATNNLETIKMMVKVGLGWSVLPNTLLDKSLIKIRIAKLQISRQLGLVWHQKRTLSNAASVMINSLSSCDYEQST